MLEVLAAEHAASASYPCTERQHLLCLLADKKAWYVRGWTFVTTKPLVVGLLTLIAMVSVGVASAVITKHHK